MERYPHSRIGRINIVEMPKLIGRTNSFPIKKGTEKYHRTHNKPQKSQTAKVIQQKEKKPKRPHIASFQNIL